MKISPNCINIITSFEGFAADKYICPAGKPTIGYGHAIRSNEQYKRITEEQARELLRQDVESVEHFINSAVHVSLTQGQFDALVSLVYNWGSERFLHSEGLEKLNKGDYNGAIEEFKEVNKVGGKVLAGLVNRREAEAELWYA